MMINKTTISVLVVIVTALVSWEIGVSHGIVAYGPLSNSIIDLHYEKAEYPDNAMVEIDRLGLKPYKPVTVASYDVNGTLNVENDSYSVVDTTGNGWAIFTGDLGYLADNRVFINCRIRTSNCGIGGGPKPKSFWRKAEKYLYEITHLKLIPTYKNAGFVVKLEIIK